MSRWLDRIRRSTISSRATAAPARAGRSCSSRTSTSSKPGGRTGRSIRSPSWNGRLLLRPRHERRQGDGGVLDGEPDSAQGRRIQPDAISILALTADEEGGNFNGVDWLLKNQRDLIDAELAINEGGGGEMKKGKYLINEVQAAEKVYQDFRLEVTQPGRAQLAADSRQRDLSPGRGPRAAGEYDFPVEPGRDHRTYFARMAALRTTRGLAADMRAVAQPTPNRPAVASASARSSYYNSLMRTTCVATRLEGGHADNALPQLAART